MPVIALVSARRSRKLRALGPDAASWMASLPARVAAAA
jgi:hypothetical protein